MSRGFCSHYSLGFGFGIFWGLTGFLFVVFPTNCKILAKQSRSSFSPFLNLSEMHLSLF